MENDAVSGPADQPMNPLRQIWGHIDALQSAIEALIKYSPNRHLIREALLAAPKDLPYEINDSQSVAQREVSKLVIGLILEGS